VYLRETRRTNRDGSVVRYTTAGSNPHLLDPQVAGHRAVIDKATATREAHLDGKWLLRTSDQTLTADDLAAAYKQLTQIERGWRDLKSSLGLRPVFHYREDRIRAHIQLCRLALLLIRVVENGTRDTWRNIRHELDRMHLVTLATGDGRVAQRSLTTSAQRTILRALALPEPARFFDFTLPASDH
jgi:transposase